MTTVGRAIRQAMADERRPPCACGHHLNNHHEYQSKWVRGETIDDDFVEIVHPRYRPGLFRCDLCECEAAS